MIFIRHHRAQTQSTNSDALALVAADAPEGTYITADSMTAGRGRQGRPWVAPKGNLYFSLILRPIDVPLVRWGELSFVAGLAAGEAVGQFGPSWQLKWPNDVLVEGAKISGILLESTAEALVMGIGINVAVAPEVPRRETIALSKYAGGMVQADYVCDVLLKRIEQYYTQWRQEGFAPIREAWLARARGIGEEIRVNLAGGQSLTGRFIGINETGGLLLGADNGSVQTILAGDVYFS